MDRILKYTGTGLEEEVSFTSSQKTNPSEKIEHYLQSYIPSEDLKEVVNLMMTLKTRPLLLMGEPGCGKTRLAEAVAYELHGDKMYDHFFRWNIKSTTTAKEGIYKYDTLKRLYHANLKTSDKSSDINIGDISKYITLNELGRAFTENKDCDLPNILLIDEIDKADIDFPNDLLLEIENKFFEIPELEKEDQPKSHKNVLIFITSNQEKELPHAFLRRCIYHFIKFPDDKLLKKIIVQHFKINGENEMLDKALTIFEHVRNEIGNSDKRPSTSELLDWYEMLHTYQKIKETTQEEDLSEVQRRLITQIEQMDTNCIPFRQLLLKTKTSLDKFAGNDVD